MTPTKVRTLLLVGLVSGVVAWALLHVVYTRLPPLTWTDLPVLLIAAGAEAWLGRDLHARILGKPGARPVQPLFVARMVALAKASALTAALIGGVAAGFMIYLSGLTADTIPRSDLVDASLAFGGSLALLAAALYLEYCCRVPKNPGGDDEKEDTPPPSPFHHGH